MDSAAPSSFSLKILGGFELRLGGETVDFSTRKTACLLAYLACTAPVPQPREKLATRCGAEETTPKPGITCATEQHSVPVPVVPRSSPPPV